MTYLLGTVAVEDFETWKSEFAENDSFRTEHGQQGYQVFQSVDDPNEITVLFEWGDDKDPQAFFRSKEMRERLGDAGVKGQPKMSAFELIERKSTPETAA